MTPTFFTYFFLKKRRQTKQGGMGIIGASLRVTQEKSINKYIYYWVSTYSIHTALSLQSEAGGSGVRSHWEPPESPTSVLPGIHSLTTTHGFNYIMLYNSNMFDKLLVSRYSISWIMTMTFAFILSLFCVWIILFIIQVF